MFVKYNFFVLSLLFVNVFHFGLSKEKPQLPKETEVLNDYDYDYDENDNDYDSIDWNNEVKKEKKQKILGISVIDEEGKHLIKNPSEKVLKYINKKSQKDENTLESIRKLYESQQEEESKKNVHKGLLYSQKDFEEMIDQENQEIEDNENEKCIENDLDSSGTCSKNIQNKKIIEDEKNQSLFSWFVSLLW